MAIQQEVPGIDTYMVDARPEQATSSAVQSGWEAAEKLTPPTGDFPVEFKHSEEWSQILCMFGCRMPIMS